MHEFNLIKQFCAFQTVERKDVILTSGDDCAIVSIPEDQQLAITTDTLISGVHFPENTSAFDIGHKCLAVNLSDLAAMGAEPAWITFALTLPQVDQAWLDELARGFFNLATQHQVQLIGGDLTRGHLSLTLQAQGLIPNNTALKRSGAKVGDVIYVTHTLGDAGLALKHIKQELEIPPSYRDSLLTRLNRPEPRVDIGKKIRGIANSCIDLSDGLSGDLSHILEKSRVGAIVYVDQLPLSQELLAASSLELATQLALSAGDDYELCFTVSKENEPLLLKTLENNTCKITPIGVITADLGLSLQFTNGKKYHGPAQSYQHF